MIEASIACDLVRDAPETVASAQVLAALKKGPLEMHILQRRLGGVAAERTIWRMIMDGDLKVRVDCRVSLPGRSVNGGRAYLGNEKARPRNRQRAPQLNNGATRRSVLSDAQRQGRPQPLR